MPHVQAPGFFQRVSTYLRIFFTSDIKSLQENMDQLDQRNREVRHDLRSIKTTTSALEALIKRIHPEHDPNPEDNYTNLPQSLKSSSDSKKSERS